MRDLFTHGLIPATLICLVAWPIAARTPQRRRDHIAHTAANMPAAQIAAQVLAMSEADWERARLMRRVELTVLRADRALLNGEQVIGDAIDTLAAAEADRADWSQVQKWSER